VIERLEQVKGVGPITALPRMKVKAVSGLADPGLVAPIPRRLPEEPHDALSASRPHREESDECQVQPCDPLCRPDSGPVCYTRRLTWAQLLVRVFAIDVLQCPKCRWRLRRIAVITDGEVNRKVLSALGLATDSPAPHPAKASDEAFGEVAIG
jgi:hypothetical protein